MSRSGKRLERFNEVYRHRRAEAKQPPKPWTWREKASVWGALTAVMCLVLIPFLDQSIKYRHSIDARLARWKADYHLTEETVEELRVIESKFRDFESPFSTAPPPSALEIEAHRQEIARHFAPEYAKMFLERKVGEPGKSHGHD